MKIMLNKTSMKDIDKRLKALEKSLNLKDARVMVTLPEDVEPRRMNFPDFVKRCRCDSVIYGFKFVGEGNESQIDMLVDLIDDFVNEKL